MEHLFDASKLIPINSDHCYTFCCPVQAFLLHVIQDQLTRVPAMKVDLESVSIVSVCCGKANSRGPRQVTWKGYSDCLIIQ